jgi:hypothetical protein
MERVELIKILENGLKAIKKSDSDISLAKNLDILGGICKHESARIQEEFVRKVDERMFKTKLDTDPV